MADDVIYDDIDYYDDIQKTIPGIRVTSGFRTPEYQEEMKRRGYTPAKNSAHLSGGGLDLLPPDGKNMAWLAQQVRRTYPDARLLNEGDHIHAVFPGYNKAPAIGGAFDAGLSNPNRDAMVRYDDDASPASQAVAAPVPTNGDPLAGAAAGNAPDMSDPLSRQLIFEQTPEYLEQRRNDFVAGSNLGPENVPGGSWAERVWEALQTGVLPPEYANVPLANSVDALLRILSASNEAIRGTPLEGLALASPLGGLEVGGAAALGRIPKSLPVRSMSDIPEDLARLQAEYPGELVGIVSDTSEVPIPANDMSAGLPRNVDQQPTFRTAANENPNEIGFDNGVVEQPQLYKPQTGAPDELPTPHNRDNLDLPDLKREMPQVLDNPDFPGKRTARMPNPDEVFADFDKEFGTPETLTRLDGKEGTQDVITYTPEEVRQLIEQRLGIRLPEEAPVAPERSPVNLPDAPETGVEGLADRAAYSEEPEIRESGEAYWMVRQLEDDPFNEAIDDQTLQNIVVNSNSAAQTSPFQEVRDIQAAIRDIAYGVYRQRHPLNASTEVPVVANDQPGLPQIDQAITDRTPETRASYQPPMGADDAFEGRAANTDTRISADKITSNPLEQDLINKGDIAHDLGFNDERRFADRRTKAYKEWDAEVTRAEEARDTAAKKFYESLSDEDLSFRVQNAPKFGNRDHIAEEVLLNRIPDETLHFEDSRKTPSSANDNQKPFDIAGADAGGVPPGEPPSGGGAGAGGEPPRGDDPVARLTAYLNRATRLRVDQAAKYSEARKERVAKMLEARKGTGGEEGFFQEKAALGGELPKVDFDPVRDNFTQDDLTDLFNRVRDSDKVSPLESVRARDGLKKLLDGTLPQPNEIALLERVFGEDFTKAALSNSSGKQKFLSAIGNGLNLPRALMSTADFSAPLRQGVFLIGRPEYWKALPGMYKYAFNAKSYEGMMDAIRQHPNYDLLTGEGGLSFTDMGGNISNREEAFASQWAEKIPVYGHIVKGSDRAYSGFLNKLRFDVANSLLEDFRKAGVEPNAKQVRDIGKFVNNATGRGELGKFSGAGPMLNNLFYSPRLIASRVNLLNPVQYAKLDPLVRREAIKSAISFGAIASTVLAIAKMNGAKIETDPRSTDFGKIQDGNTRYDIFGGFQQYARLAAQLATNQRKTLKGKVQDMDSGKFGQMTAYDDVTAFVRSKLNPIIGYMVNSRVGKNPAGEDFEWGKDTMNLFIPLVTQDLQDAYKDGGWENVAKSAPASIHGVGVQTFDPNKPRASSKVQYDDSVKYDDAPQVKYSD